MSETESIQELKEKLHKSFIQMRDIEKIYEGEIEIQRQHYEQTIALLQSEKQDLANRLKTYEKTEVTTGDEFFFEGLDQTKIQIEIEPLQNSIQQEESIADLFRKGTFLSRKEQLSELESEIRRQIENISADLEDYFGLAIKVAEQNQNLRDQLFAATEKIQIQTRHFEDSSRLAQELYKTTAKLKEDNNKLAEMYREQLEKNQKPQEKLQENKFKTWRDFPICNGPKGKPAPAVLDPENGRNQFKKFLKKHVSCNDSKS